MEGGNLLDSWKEVAAYLKKSEKTCRRWEETQRLPVHRLDASKRAHIFAYKDELDQWMQNRSRHLGRVSEHHLIQSLNRHKKKAILVVSTTVALIIVLIAFWPSLFPTGPLARSIAILPFADLSPDNEYQYLGDGIALALSKALRLMGGWEVAAWPSAYYIKAQTMSISEIGRKLNVKTVLDGSIQVSGDKLTVEASLVNAKDNRILWTETYERNAKDILGVQNDVANSIIVSLKGNASQKPIKLLDAKLPSNNQAYDSFLRGVSAYNKRGQGPLEAAIYHFSKAIEYDPSYAAAYAGLAEVYLILVIDMHWPPEKGFPLAKEAAAKALKINPDIPETRAAMGLATMCCDWDFEGASGEFLRAIELDPGYLVARHHYGFFLAALGRHDDALEQFRIAGEIDPLDTQILICQALICYFARRFEQALVSLEKARAINPSGLLTAWIYAYVYCAMGKYEEALNVIDEAFRFIKPSGQADILGIVAFIKARMGQFEEARKILDDLIKNKDQNFISSTMLAAVYGALGERDNAFKLLDVAFRERQPQLLWANSDALFDPLRQDPRFADLMKKIWTK